MDIRPVGVELFHAIGRKDGHGEASSRFFKFCESAQYCNRRSTQNVLVHVSAFPTNFRETTLNPSGRSSRHSHNLVTIKDINVCVHIYRVSQEECARLREGVPYVKVYRYNPKHLCPKLNGYGDNGQRSLKL